MENRFAAVSLELGQTGPATKAPARTLRAVSSAMPPWVRPMSAADRALVILLENGGVDLGIPALAEKLLSAIPRSDLLPDSARGELVSYLQEKIRSFTDSLLETAELAANRYAAAKPAWFGDVIVLRDGT